MTALLPPLLPALAGGCSLLLRGRPIWALRSAILVLGATAVAGAFAAAQGATISWPWGPGLRLHLGAVGFARVMVVLVPLVAAAVLAYIDTGEELAGSERVRLVVAICGFTAAMELLVLAGDLLTLLIGWELVGALSWLLIGFYWQEADRPRSAAIAFLTTRFGDLGLYLAAAAAFTAVGSLEFDGLMTVEGPYRHVILGGVLLAAAAKSAQLPFSPWLYAAMAGPTPVSALLHSATLVAAGAYLLIRLGPLGASVAWFGPAVISVGAATLVTGGLAALVQTDMKRALAASTCSQYGLMFVAVGAGATAAAAAHLVSHALFKSLLFLGAGIAIHAAGTRDMANMRLGRALPGAAALFAVGALSLAAVPPTGGGITKEWIVAATMELSPTLGYAVLASGFFTAAYAARLMALTYGPGEANSVRTPGRGEIVSLGTLALFSVGMSVLLLPGGRVASEALLHAEPEGGASWELWVSLLAIALATGVVAWLWHRRTLLTFGLTPRMQHLLGNWFGLASVAQYGVARPVVAAATWLAMMDDRAVDAGVRGVAVAGARLSRTLAEFGERGLDGVVKALTAGALGFAVGSRVLDDRGIDVAVEGVATLTQRGGARSRRLQTGMTHHYFLVAGVGLLIMLGVSILWGVT